MGIGVWKGSLSLIAITPALRCDAKQADERFAQFDARMREVPHELLGHWLPTAFIKGDQPRYIEDLDDYDGEAVKVINTLSIRGLRIRTKHCRCITAEDFEEIDVSKRPRTGDVLLTVDGGTSIGKPVLFELEGPFAIDSHVAILRPQGIDPRLLVYLLASPLGQIQFQRAESGASGQTAVTEQDLRRFVFPKIEDDAAASLIAELRHSLASVHRARKTLLAQERRAWQQFGETLMMPVAY